MFRVIAVLGLICCAQAQVWEWRATAPLGTARSEACALRLADGRVMVTGGNSDSPLTTVEIYRTAPDESFSAAASLLHARAGHACTLLEDGRVLVAGGNADSVEVWEPSLDSWSEVKSTVVRGPGTTAVRLLDGRILIAGGGSATLETFDSNSGQLTVLDATLSSPRSGHTATILNDGKVLIAGGTGEQGPLNTAEIFDPETNAMRPVPAMSTARTGHSATLLLDSRVLLAGGSNADGELNSLEMYLPETNRFDVLGASLKDARTNHVGVLVETNGTVLITGGSLKGDALPTTELFDPSTNQVSSAGSLTAARTGIAGVMLEDGRVLATGGRNAQGPSAACGVINTTAMKFTQAVYHPLEKAIVTGNLGLPVTATATLKLEQISAVTGAKTTVNSRLLVTTLTVTNGVISSTGIMNIFRDDIGNDFLLTASGPSNIALQARFSAKLRSVLTVTVNPATVVQGQSLNMRLQLSADGANVQMSGTLTARSGLTSASKVVSATAASFTTSLSTCCEATGSVNISATYTGNAFLEPASVTGPLAVVVSRTPVISILFTQLQLASPANILARVSPAGFPPNGVTIDPALVPTGTATLLRSGAALSTATLQPTQGTTLSVSPSYPTADATFTYTPTAADRRTGVCLDAAYAGDSRYLTAATNVSSLDGSVRFISPCLSVGPAFSLLQSLTPPTNYTLGTPSHLVVRLTWPNSVGIVNRVVNLTAGGRSIGQITLVPNAQGLGIADGSGDFLLPFNTSNLTYSYAASGDLAASSATTTIAMNRVATAMTLQMPTTTTNPFTIRYTLTLSTGGVALPPGTVLGGQVEFRDGDTLLGTLPAPPLPTTGTGISDGSSNTILIGNPSVSGTLTNVIRPVGARAITVRYLGSPQFVDSQGSATVTVQ